MENNTVIPTHEINTLLSVSEEMGVLILNESGSIVQSNEQIMRELGYTKEEMSVKTIFEINPNISFRDWKVIWKNTFEGIELEDEVEYITSADIIYPVYAYSKALTYEGSAYCCLISKNVLDNNRYRNILQLTNRIARMGHWEWDLLQDEFQISRAAYDLIGADYDSIIGRKNTIQSILKPNISKNQFKKLVNILNRCIEEGKPMEFEFEINSRNLPDKKFMLYADPVLIDNRTVRIYGVLQNITSFSGRSEEMYLAKASLENTDEMVFWVDEDASFIYANSACCDNLGYDISELLELNVFDVDPNFNRNMWKPFWDDALIKRTLDFDSSQKGIDGTTYPTHVNITVVEHKGKNIMCASVRNMTKLKESQDKLLLTQKTVDQAMDQILWVNDDASISYYNDSFKRRIGYSDEEIKQLKVWDIDPAMKPEMWEPHRKELMEVQQIEAESKHISKDGTVYPVRVSLSLVEVEGKIIHCAFIRDISKRVEKEKQLYKLLEENNKLKEQLEKENAYLTEEVNLKFSFDKIITNSAAYRKVLRQVQQVADTNATVLILGETGTGKELLARSIHTLSERSKKAMVKINCAALPPNLIESELFGHEKGSFTGAHQQKVGKFELADNGTIFLDEIGELPIDLQAKLLRVLQEGEFERLGGNTTLSVDVRVIAATNRNLEQLVEEGKFRTDLYYRLNVFPIQNLPLRHRREDIPLLARHFLKIFCEKTGKKITKILKNDLRKLMDYEFPGNVRELENIIERAVILTTGDTLHFNIFDKKSKEKTKTEGLFMPLEEVQKNHIIEALKRSNWKVSGKMSAAEMLRLNPKTLASKMRKLGIRRTDYVM